MDAEIHTYLSIYLRRARQATFAPERKLIRCVFFIECKKKMLAFNRKSQNFVIFFSLHMTIGND